MAQLGTFPRGAMAQFGTSSREGMALRGTFSRVARRHVRHRLISKRLPGHCLAGASVTGQLGSFRAGVFAV
jgi:hypothetical protein